MTTPNTQQQLKFLHELYSHSTAPELRLMILGLAESVKQAEELRDFKAEASLRRNFGT